MLVTNLKILAVGVGALLMYLPWAGAAESIAAAEVDFFEKSVRPILVERCYECHSSGASKIKSGLLLDNRAGWMKGGNSGQPAIVPGHPEKSLLIKAVDYEDEDLQMPPKHRMDPNEIAVLEEWVKRGAPDPRDGAAPTNVVVSQAIDWEKARQFWSFKPLRHVAPPSVKNPSWVRTDVDRFILQKLEEKSLAPVSDADRRVLIRRATFDLIGLPPSPEEINDFLADQSPKAFENVVNRLLASRQYGERWGRHWLDLVRYADTSGCNSDYPIPSAYKYRNYVIDAFNKDKPYQQFVREQIAGDLLASTNDEERIEHVVATGYLAVSRRFGSRAAEFHLTLEDTIDNMGKAVLGLGVGCARCHDHKFDPIATKDYYALYGIFNSTKFAFPGTEIYKHPKDFIPLASREDSDAYYKDREELAALDDQIEKLTEMKKAFERVEKEVVAKVDKQEDEPGALQVERKDTVNPPELKTLLEVKATLEDARTRQRLLENKAYKFEKAYAVSEGKPANAKIQIKGDPKTPGEEAPRGFLTVLGGETIPDTEQGSGRKELAEWLTAINNPLTARVMANRIWQMHFGKGIVRTPNDFGARGKAPTHPELLDWLAGKFSESGWSIKAMHKLIMLSHAYQLSSADKAQNSTIDLNNDCLWRFDRRRLDAEEIRDAMLAISGTLDRSVGEAHPFPPESEWKYTQHRPFVALYESNKRSVYLMQQRIKRHPFFELFDGADPNATTGERAINTTPLQALFMMNDRFAHDQAGQFAVRIGLAQRDDRDRINYAFLLAYSRPADPDEIDASTRFLRECRDAIKQTNVPADQQERATLASFTRTILSSSEFLYVD